uniref:Uncharacterized protein n=1 Tax=Rhinolophus ferrumequinum TaxID=59479 RepID=A0A671FRR7_RHIFE
MAQQVPKSGLLECPGNICGSPIAEAVSRILVTDQNVSHNWLDSAVTSTNSKAILELLGSCNPQKQLIIEDPYHGDDSSFEIVYQ